MPSAAKLTPAQKLRYARQLLLREVGETGQLRLSAAFVHLPGAADPRAAQVATDYLERAGVRVAAVPGAHEVALPDAAGVRALAGTPELDEAASALHGAFAAVEALKATLEVGVPAQLPASLQFQPRPVP